MMDLPRDVAIVSILSKARRRGVYDGSFAPFLPYAKQHIKDLSLRDQKEVRDALREAPDCEGGGLP